MLRPRKAKAEQKNNYSAESFKTPKTMSVDDCIFCKIVAGEIPCSKVYEDESVLAFLDVGPLSVGHTLVIPKEHFCRLDECPEDLLAKVSGCVGRICPAVVDAVEADGYNVLCNTGKAAGQVVEHVHFHIIPRKSGDGVFDRWPAGKYEDGQAEVVLKSICEKL